MSWWTRETGVTEMTEPLCPKCQESEREKQVRLLFSAKESLRRDELKVPLFLGVPCDQFTTEELCKILHQAIERNSWRLP